MTWQPKVQQYQIPPAGLFVATCCDLAERGQHLNKFNGKLESKISLHFVLDEVDEDGKPFIVQRWFTDTWSEKGNLRQFIESWFGRKLTTDEAAAFTEGNILGKGIQIQIVHKKKADGNIRAEVTTCLPLAKGQAPPVIPDTYTRVKDRPPKDSQPPF